jgi:hypothetical protein
VKSYLYAVQDDQGREVVSWSGEVEKVSDVTAKAESQGNSEDTVYLLDAEGKILSSALVAGAKGLVLHRWPADDKLSAPVSHAVEA